MTGLWSIMINMEHIYYTSIQMMIYIMAHIMSILIICRIRNMLVMLLDLLEVYLV